MVTIILAVGDPECDFINGYLVITSIATRVNSSLDGYLKNEIAIELKTKSHTI